MRSQTWASVDVDGRHLGLEADGFEESGLGFLESAVDDQNIGEIREHDRPGRAEAGRPPGYATSACWWSPSSRSARPRLLCASAERGSSATAVW